jgi:type I restriction enzyme, S subunit
VSMNEKETRALPDGWVLTNVEDVVLPTLHRVPETEFVYVDIGSVNSDGHIVEPKRVNPEDAPSRARKEIRYGDTIFATIRPYLKNIAFISKDLDNQICSTGFCVLRPAQSGIEPRFLLWLARSDDVVSQIGQFQRGASYPAVSDKDVLRSRIPLPPLNEQKRIVEKLEVLLSDLDAAVQSLTTALENLKDYRRSVLKAAVEGELTREWREANQATLEPASELLTRILQERRERWEAEQKAKDRKNAVYEEPAAPDVSSLLELPEGWVWATVEQLGFVQLGRQRSPKNRSKDYSTKYVRAGNITENGWDLSSVLEMEFEPHELETYRLHVGDILLSEASGSPDQVGKPAIWAGEIEVCCFQNTLIRFRQILLSSEYPYLVFRHFYFNKVFAQISGGVSINHLSAYKFKSIAFPLPSLKEQEKIFETAFSNFAAADELEANIKTQLIQAEQTRQSMLEEAFSGKLVPQDPNDEPATVLLERIREEKIRASQEAKVKKPKSTKPKTPQGRELTSLADTLRTAGKALTPEELFRAAGYTFETKEQFFQDIRKARADSLIEEKRLAPNARDSLLSVLA